MKHSTSWALLIFGSVALALIAGACGGGESSSESEATARVILDLPDLNSGDTAVVELSREKRREIGVASVQITFLRGTSGLTVRIEKPTQSSVGSPPSVTVYSYLALEVDDLPESDITEVIIAFDVPYPWLEANQVDEKQIVLLRLAEGEWNPLETTLVDRLESIALYEAVSPGLSLFAIATSESERSEAQPSLQNVYRDAKVAWDDRRYRDAVELARGGLDALANDVWQDLTAMRLAFIEGTSLVALGSPSEAWQAWEAMVPPGAEVLRGVIKDPIDLDTATVGLLQAYAQEQLGRALPMGRDVANYLDATGFFDENFDLTAAAAETGILLSEFVRLDNLHTGVLPESIANNLETEIGELGLSDSAMVVSRLVFSPNYRFVSEALPDLVIGTWKIISTALDPIGAVKGGVLWLLEAGAGATDVLVDPDHPEPQSTQELVNGLFYAKVEGPDTAIELSFPDAPLSIDPVGLSIMVGDRILEQIASRLREVSAGTPYDASDLNTGGNAYAEIVGPDRSHVFVYRVHFRGRTDRDEIVEGELAYYLAAVPITEPHDMVVNPGIPRRDTDPEARGWRRYYLALAQAALPDDDDHPDAYPNGTSVTVPSNTAGEIEVQGDRDLFKFSGQDGLDYTARVDTQSLSAAFVRVYNQDGFVVAESGDSNTSWTAEGSQTFYVDVWGSGTGTYRLDLASSTPPPSPPPPDDDDHPDAYPNGTSVTVPSNTAGEIEVQGDRDLFKFSGQDGLDYAARVDTQSLSASFVRVYNQDGFVVAESGDGNTSWTAEGSQTFYVDVWGSGTGTYRLDLASSLDVGTLDGSPPSWSAGSSEATNTWNLTNNTGLDLLQWTLYTSDSWISFSPHPSDSNVGGDGVGQLEVGASLAVPVTIDRSGLAPGTYTGSIWVDYDWSGSRPEVPGGTATLSITMTVDDVEALYALVNPSFELGTNSPEGWTWPSPGLTGLTWDNQMAHSGQRSIRWSAPILFSSEYGCLYGVPREFGVESAPVRIDPATTYKISVWGKGSIAGSWISSLSASVKVFDGTGEQIPVQWPGFGVQASEGWNMASTTIGPDGDRPWPDGAMLMTVNLTNGFEAYRQPTSCNNEVLDVWADSVSLQPV